jgi:hypothetical protein
MASSRWAERGTILGAEDGRQASKAIRFDFFRFVSTYSILVPVHCNNPIFSMIQRIQTMLLCSLPLAGALEQRDAIRYAMDFSYYRGSPRMLR